MGRTPCEKARRGVPAVQRPVVLLDEPEVVPPGLMLPPPVVEPVEPPELMPPLAEPLVPPEVAPISDELELLPGPVPLPATPAEPAELPLGVPVVLPGGGAAAVLLGGIVVDGAVAVPLGGIVVDGAVAVPLGAGVVVVVLEVVDLAGS